MHPRLWPYAFRRQLALNLSRHAARVATAKGARLASREPSRSSTPAVEGPKPPTGSKPHTRPPSRVDAAVAAQSQVAQPGVVVGRRKGAGYLPNPVLQRTKAALSAQTLALTFGHVPTLAPVPTLSPTPTLALALTLAVAVAPLSSHSPSTLNRR